MSNECFCCSPLSFSHVQESQSGFRSNQLVEVVLIAYALESRFAHIIHMHYYIYFYVQNYLSKEVGKQSSELRINRNVRLYIT